MNRQDIYAPELAPSSGHFAHGVAVEGGRTIYVSGQVARNADGSVEGVGDPARQTEKLLANMRCVLAQAGATLADVVQVIVYVTRMEDVPQIHAVRERCFGDCRPASTLVEVSRLRHPDFLVEMAAIAVLD